MSTQQPQMVHKYLNDSWQLVDTSKQYWATIYAFSSSGRSCTRNLPPSLVSIDPTTGAMYTVNNGKKKPKKVYDWASLYDKREDATEKYMERISEHISSVVSTIDSTIGGLLEKSRKAGFDLTSLPEFFNLQSIVKKYAQIL